MPIPAIVPLLMTVALTLTTAGPGAGDAATTTRRINVAMQDNTFSPNVFDVRAGDTVTFVFTNFGRAVHDAFIGDKAAQEHHEDEMRKTQSGHDHEHEGGVTVHPGKSGTLHYSFDKPGTLEIGCHQPGHYRQGMAAIVNVHPA
jgi:uncharacterized cupredoxin-like copper-binding protein